MPTPAKLAIVKEREGNPGKRPIPEGLRLPPTAPEEPDWGDVFPGEGEAERYRTIAHRTWERTVQILDPQGVLAAIDLGALRMLCIYEAMFDGATRDVAEKGRMMKGYRGELVRNPSLMTLNQMAEKLPGLYAKFGMTPLDRDRLNPRDPNKQADSPFDV